MDEIDLTTDEAWEPMFNPYFGHIAPAWTITAAAQFHMGEPLQHAHIFARYELRERETP